jgi:glutamyl-tRNA reductase
VVASLDSLVVGEPQITAQVKAAFAVARRANATGPLFDQVFERAFAVAKRVRTDTRIGEQAVSVSYAAVELAQKIFRELEAKTIRDQELAKLFAKHGAFSEGEREAIAAMASSIVNKLLHAPIVRLKQDSQAKGGSRYLQALRELFSLDEERA